MSALTGEETSVAALKAVLDCWESEQTLTDAVISAVRNAISTAAVGAQQGCSANEPAGDEPKSLSHPHSFYCPVRCWCDKADR